MGEKRGGVGWNRGSTDIPDDRDGELDLPPRIRRGSGMTTLVSLIISGLMLSLVWSILWERNHPAGAPARQLRRGDLSRRLKAVEDLERLGPDDPEVAMPALIGGLSDPIAAVRDKSARAMVAVVQGAGSHTPEPDQIDEAVRALLVGVKDPVASVRISAAQALWMIVILWQGAPRAVDRDVVAAAMVELAEDPDPKVRMTAVRGIGVVGLRISDDPPPRLMAALDDESGEIRASAAQLLGMFRIGLPRVLPELMKSIDTVRPEHRAAYLSVLDHIYPSAYARRSAGEIVASLVSALQTRNPRVRRKVVWLLGEFGPGAEEAIPALAAILRASDDDESDPMDPGPPPAAGPIASTGSEVLPAGLDGVITRESGDLAIGAAYALARVAGLPALAGNAGAVAHAGEAVAALEGLLRSPRPDRRTAAATALRGFLPDAALVPALSRAVVDGDETVRAAALETLRDYAGRLSFPAPPGIAEALEDRSPRVRRAAAAALAHLRIGVEPTVPALIRHAVGDPDPEVRAMCSVAVHELAPPTVTAAVVPLLIRAMDDPRASADLRGSATDALSRLGASARGAVPAIVRALRSADAKGSGAVHDVVARVVLRRIAARALGMLAPGTPSAEDAIAALTDCLNDPPDEMAATALAAFGPSARPAVPTIARTLRAAADRKQGRQAARLADALRRIDPASPESDQAVAILVKLVRAEPKLHQISEVIDALARFGPGAGAAALPRLRELADSQDSRVSEAARNAVTAIEVADHRTERAPTLFRGQPISAAQPPHSTSTTAASGP